jgi:hypothetical protein
MKSSALAALLAVVPIATSADPDPVLYVPRSERFIQHLYVKERTSIDVALPEHESLKYDPVIIDRRWHMVSGSAGNVVHLSFEATPHASEQLVHLWGSKHAMFLVLSSGPNESTAQTVVFYEPTPRATARPVLTYNPAPSVTPAAVRPRPAPTPRILAVKSCDGLDHDYKWRRDDGHDFVRDGVCNDGKHTFILVRDGHNVPGVVPYRVDPGGRQDQLMNSTFVNGVGEYKSQWVVDGTPDRIAFVADSSSGQIRKTVCHPPDRGCDGR